MAHRRDAERVVKNLDGEKMAGEKVDIQHAKGTVFFKESHCNLTHIIYSANFSPPGCNIRETTFITYVVFPPLDIFDITS